jgi:hypothetical protein
MTAFRTGLVVALLGLSMAAPMVAVCSACCPAGQVLPRVIEPAACCGECVPDLEKPDPASSLAAKRMTTDAGWIPLVDESVVPREQFLTTKQTQIASISRLLVPPESLLPLRL